MARQRHLGHFWTLPEDRITAVPSCQRVAFVLTLWSFWRWEVDRRGGGQCHQIHWPTRRSGRKCKIRRSGSVSFVQGIEPTPSQRTDPELDQHALKWKMLFRPLERTRRIRFEALAPNSINNLFLSFLFQTSSRGWWQDLSKICHVNAYTPFKKKQHEKQAWEQLCKNPLHS